MNLQEQECCCHPISVFYTTTSYQLPAIQLTMMNFFRSLFGRSKRNSVVAPAQTPDQDQDKTQVAVAAAAAAAPAAAPKQTPPPTNARIRRLRVLIEIAERDLATAPGPFRKNGTPDMRYRANQEWAISCQNTRQTLPQLKTALRRELEKETRLQKLREEMEDPREREAIARARREGAYVPTYDGDQLLCAAACTGCLAALISAFPSD